MFTSSYHHTIDAKNRLFIPAKFREEFGGEIVISPSIRGNYLNVYSTEEWDRYLEPIKKLDRVQSEPLLRVMNGNSLRQPLDATGRVQLTQELVDYAGLESKAVVIVGCGDYAEIWSEEEYEKTVKSADIDKMRMMLESAGL